MTYKKVGKSVIKEDPHTMSGNGKIMLDVIMRQQLVITNSLDICKGTITRQRNSWQRYNLLFSVK